MDYLKISAELTMGFILHEYQERYPQLIPTDFKEKALMLYRTDPVFHNRVDYIVSFIMGTIHNNCDKEAKTP